MTMTAEQECIRDLYLLIEQITEMAKKGDLSLFKIHSISGADAYQGMPPICRKRDALLSEYEDIIHDALLGEFHGNF